MIQNEISVPEITEHINFLDYTFIIWSLGQNRKHLIWKSFFFKVWKIKSVFIITYKIEFHY